MYSPRYKPKFSHCQIKWAGTSFQLSSTRQTSFWSAKCFRTLLHQPPRAFCSMPELYVSKILLLSSKYLVQHSLRLFNRGHRATIERACLKTCVGQLFILWCWRFQKKSLCSDQKLLSGLRLSVTCQEGREAIQGSDVTRGCSPSIWSLSCCGPSTVQDQRWGDNHLLILKLVCLEINALLTFPNTSTTKS